MLLRNLPLFRIRNSFRPIFSLKCFSTVSNEGHPPVQVCVVGSGPSGFYTVDRLLKKLGQGVQICLVDRLPTPFGLVRSGVAPDHQDTKNVTRQFGLLGADPRVHFFGGVRVGSDVGLTELRKLFDVVVLACGCEGDRNLRIPGVIRPPLPHTSSSSSSPLPLPSPMKDVISAREFVWWYNGHPEAASLPINLDQVESVAICGIGNVALDCARVLLRPAATSAASTDALHKNLTDTSNNNNNNNNNNSISKEEEKGGANDLLLDLPKLAKTDIAEHALRQLRNRDIRDVLEGNRMCLSSSSSSSSSPSSSSPSSSLPTHPPTSFAALKNLRHVHIIARRGPIQAACTVKELKELLTECGVTPHFNRNDFVLSPTDYAEVAATRQRKRLLEVFTAALGKEGEGEKDNEEVKVKVKEDAENTRGKRNLYFHFYRSPVEIVRDINGDIKGLDAEVMALRPSAKNPRQQEAVGTGTREHVPCQLVLVSIGYKGVSIPGAPFDDSTGTVPNENGRVKVAAGAAQEKEEEEKVGGKVGGGGAAEKGQYEKGLYVVGWLKRGPSGIVGTNLVDADDTVAAILSDLKEKGEKRDEERGGDEKLRELLGGKGVKVYNWKAWQAIDKAEVARGVERGKVREKIVRIQDMREAVAAGTAEEN